ncbi:amino acid ABC transporter permease [Lichenifustis flavocetrariae]|uniref:Amino acid ABC transporter permease n=1 Tax=Lichenifustis flavocetrariae TaxID=2949735 RepID=A0AA41YUQ6_9HYPH|nr:amino acid ABC transporter permease [Lichenifustis flavocetrariae]MCW6507556.1 amino acid ABC transporter permease [Lichenifustis flavocetrariae]
MANTSTLVKPDRGSILNDPKARSLFYQVVLAAVVIAVFYGAYSNTSRHMADAHIPTGFSFWNAVAGFDINQTLIPYTQLSTYGRAFWVGLVNTLLVAVLGIVLTTIIGFTVGVARLSPNWIVAKVAMVYVEVIRNIPLLLQLLFWYNAVLKPLPAPKQSIQIPGGIFLNNRGIIVPDPQFGAGSGWVGLALLFGIVASFGFYGWASVRQKKTGQQAPVLLVAAALIIGLPLLVFFLLGSPITFEAPVLKGFNFRGGRQIFPELAALLLGLSVYTASFIAEIVRAGIQSVGRGQSEAAHALGLNARQTLRLVVIPQAMRVIIPPLTSQYLNLTKNSSLAVFIGYPDLVAVFAGTVLNQTGAAVQVMAITMAVYLVISLVTSFAMNLFNKRNALVER